MADTLGHGLTARQGDAGAGKGCVSSAEMASKVFWDPGTTPKSTTEPAGGHPLWERATWQVCRWEGLVETLRKSPGRRQEPAEGFRSKGLQQVFIRS